MTNALPEHPDEGFSRAWTRFWFAPTDPIGLHVTRTLTGLLLLTWLVPFAGHVEAFFGLSGWLDQQGLTETVQVSGGAAAPPWSILYLCGTNSAALTAVYWSSVGVLALFTLGILPRLTAVLAWVVVASFTANPVLEYEGDALLLMLSFYLMIGYVLMGQLQPGQSLLSRLFGGIWLGGPSAGAAAPLAAPSSGANLALRLIQIHFAIMMVTSGLHKLQFGDWWAGVALWFPLYPPFKTKLSDVLANKPNADSAIYLVNIASYLTLAWQIGFPIFAWRSWGWLLLLAGGLLGWIACFWFYATPLIGPAVLICCLSYLPSATWRRVFKPRGASAESPGQAGPAAVGHRQGVVAAAPRAR